MGKYKPPEETGETFSPESEQFRHIANELAEANRLKRFELQNNVRLIIDEKELEDEA